MKRTPKAHSQPTRAELKAQLLAQAEATIKQFLDWLGQTELKCTHKNSQLGRIGNLFYNDTEMLLQRLAESTFQRHCKAA